MKKSTLFLQLLFLVTAIGLYSCKGKEGTPGPVGPKGEQGIKGDQGPTGAYNPDLLWTMKEGSVKGTLTGSTLSNKDYQYTLDFTGVSTDYDNYYVSSSNGYEVNIYKAYAGEGESFRKAYVQINFDVADIKNPSNPIINGVSLQFVKPMGTDSLLFITRNSTDNASNIVNLSNLSFDASTKILTGDFNLSIVKNSSSGAFSISNGSFSTKLKYIQARRGVFAD